MDKIQEDCQEEKNEQDQENPENTKAVAADQQDIELYNLIENHLINEDNLKNVYNDYRKHKGLEPLNFEKNPHDPVTL